MSVSITAILAIEDSLANRLTKTWKRIVAEMVAVAMPYVERKEWDKAYKLADRLDMSPVFDQNREFIKYCTYSSMLFGASRLRKDLKNSAVANKSWGWFIDDVLQGMRVQIIDNVGKQARELYFAEIGRLEEEAKTAQLESILKYDKDQPRDENGRWTDSLMGEDDFYKSKGLEKKDVPYKGNEEYWSEYFEKERPLKKQWEQRMDRAISTGEITEEEARSKYGFMSDARNYGGYKDLPETLWHVTTALSKIQEGGFKTRDETGRSGLGGGTSDTISFTDNPEMARGYLEAMKFARNYMRGDFGPEDLIQQAKDAGYYADVLDTYQRESRSERNGMPSRLADAIEGVMSWSIPDGFKDATQERLEKIMSYSGANIQGARREGDFFIKDLDHKDKQRQRAELLTRWLFWRERKTGKVDPVFFTNNWDDLINTPDGDIALVEVKTKPKSRGYYLPAEHEFRVKFGDLVQLRSIVAKYDGSVTKAEKETFLKPFTSFEKGGRTLLQLVSQLHTSRLSAFGFCAEAEVMEVNDYQITEQLDNRVCPVCALMSGKTFRVEAARNSLISIITEKNPDNLKAMQPWPKQTKANLEKMKRMESQDFIDANLHIPPYHPWCRGLLVPVGKAPKLKPQVVAEPEAVINAPTAEEVQSTFQELNLTTTPELAQAWVTTIAQPPMVVLSNVLGKKLSDLHKLMMEAEKQSKLSAIGITAMSWDKQYLRLAGRSLLDEDVPWSVKLNFYDRRWELTRLMSEDPEFRMTVMQHWGPYFDDLGLEYLE